MSRVDKEKFRKSISDSRLAGIMERGGQPGHPHSEETKMILSEKAKLRLSVPANNPMFGKKRSEESKQKQSKTRAQRYVDGMYAWKTWSKGGYAETTKAGRIFCRSSWEMYAAHMLDADVSVRAFEFEPFSIPYYKSEGDRKNLRHYVPDFLVEHTDGRRVLIEVKPECHVGADVNVAKFSAAREYCDARGMTFEVWTEKKLRP